MIKQDARDRVHRKDPRERIWYARVPVDKEYWSRVDFLRRNGLLANVLSWQSEEFYGLEVRPLERMATDKPPWIGSPWHITIGTLGPHTQPYHSKIRDLMRRFARPQRVRLQFAHFNDRGHAQLEPKRDPIASDPQVKELKALDPTYRNIDLHISM